MSNTLKAITAAFFAVITLSTGANAEILIEDPYVRSSGANAKSGAAFMIVKNTGTEADRLIATRSDVARRVELHGHFETDDGVMQMREIEGGIEIPAQGMAMLQRGGMHVMFMGLNQSLVQGETIKVILVFETAGEITLEIPVDQDRAPRKMMDHGAMTTETDS